MTTDIAYCFGRVTKKRKFSGVALDYRTGIRHSFYAGDVCGLTIGQLRQGDKVVFLSAPSTRRAMPRAKKVHKRDYLVQGDLS